MFTKIEIFLTFINGRVLIIGAVSNVLPILPPHAAHNEFYQLISAYINVYVCVCVHECVLVFSKKNMNTKQ